MIYVCAHTYVHLHVCVQVPVHNSMHKGVTVYRVCMHVCACTCVLTHKHVCVYRCLCTTVCLKVSEDNFWLVAHFQGWVPGVNSGQSAFTSRAFMEGAASQPQAVFSVFSG